MIHVKGSNVGPVRETVANKRSDPRFLCCLKHAASSRAITCSLNPTRVVPRIAMSSSHNEPFGHMFLFAPHFLSLMEWLGKPRTRSLRLITISKHDPTDFSTSQLAASRTLSHRPLSLTAN